MAEHGPSENDLLERATTLCERYGEVIVQISDLLGDTAVPEAARIAKARAVIAGLADREPLFTESSSPDREGAE